VYLSLERIAFVSDRNGDGFDDFIVRNAGGRGSGPGRDHRRGTSLHRVGDVVARRVDGTLVEQATVAFDPIAGINLYTTTVADLGNSGDGAGGLLQPLRSWSRMRIRDDAGVQ
jgi:hypothetical protein